MTVFVVLAAVSGVGIWQHLRPKRVTYRLEFRPARDPSPAVRLRADGRELGVFTAPATLALPSRPHRKFEPEALLPKLTAQMLSPCGWRDVSVAVDGAPSAEELRAAERDHQELPLRVTSGSLQLNHAEFWTDNRGGPEARLAIGQMEVKLPADAHQEYALPLADCAEGLAVTLDGKKVAELPPAITQAGFDQGSTYSLGHPDVDESVSRVFLLDVSGARCYRITEKKYGKPGADYFGFAPGETEMTYRRKHLHRMMPTDVHFFLEKAPKTLQVSTQFSAVSYGMFELRNELVEIPCR
ncbi:MAG TPA: hypothetical protein VMN03_00270 [Burkholderiales bacterium]|nr:hypothetical protein [Burkholderiales bacterium]